MNEETIGDRIVTLREERGWRREELATRSEVSVAALTDLENNVTKSPRRSTIRALAQAFGVPIEALTGEDPKPTPAPHNEDQVELLEVYDDLNVEFRVSLMRSARGLLREQLGSQHGQE